MLTHICNLLICNYRYCLRIKYIIYILYILGIFISSQCVQNVQSVPLSHYLSVHTYFPVITPLPPKEDKQLHIFLAYVEK